MTPPKNSPSDALQKPSKRLIRRDESSMFMPKLSGGEKPNKNGEVTNSVTSHIANLTPSLGLERRRLKPYVPIISGLRALNIYSTGRTRAPEFHRVFGRK